MPGSVVGSDGPDLLSRVSAESSTPAVRFQGATLDGFSLPARPLRSQIEGFQGISQGLPSTTVAPLEQSLTPPTTAAPTPPPRRLPRRRPRAAPAPVATKGDPNDPATWDRLAKCEASGNWYINSGNGYYGGLQFSASTWRSVGGTGLPHQNSREVQIEMGKRLLARAGWGSWPSCSADSATADPLAAQHPGDPAPVSSLALEIDAHVDGSDGVEVVLGHHRSRHRLRLTEAVAQPEDALAEPEPEHGDATVREVGDVRLGREETGPAVHRVPLLGHRRPVGNQVDPDLGARPPSRCVLERSRVDVPAAVGLAGQRRAPVLAGALRVPLDEPDPILGSVQLQQRGEPTTGRCQRLSGSKSGSPRRPGRCAPPAAVRSR